MNIGRKEGKLLFRSIRFSNCVKSSLPLIFLLVFLFSIAIAPAAYAAGGDLGGGSGSQTDPYLIEDAADLAAFRDGVNNGTYTSSNARLTANIDLSEYENWTPIANYSADNPILYTGTFDGGGHTISGLVINSSDRFVGLFGFIGSGGKVQNLVLSGPTVAYSYVASDPCVGTIAGYNDGTIQNCSVTTTDGVGSVAFTNAEGFYCRVGGIVGYNYNSVKNCMSSVAVNYDSSKASEIYVGGIVGYNSVGNVANCLFAGEITDNSTDPNYEYVGGIVGGNGGDVTNCAYVENGNYTDGTEVGTVAIEGSAFAKAIADAIEMTLSASIDPETIYLKNGTTDIKLVFSADADQVDTDGASVALNGSNGVAALESSASEIDAIKVTPLGVGDTKLTVEDVTFRAPDVLETIGAYEDEWKEGVNVEAVYSVDDDSYDTKGLTFTIPLTVAENRIPLTAISLTEEEVTLKAYDVTTIYVTLTPIRASIDSVTWKSDNENVATVWSLTGQDGVVTGVSEGTANINVTVKDEFGTEYTAACKVTVTAADADTPESSSGDSGGGCNAGIGALALLALIPFAMRRKR